MSTDFDLITSICTGQVYCTFLAALSQPLSLGRIDQVICPSYARRIAGYLSWQVHDNYPAAAEKTGANQNPVD